MKLLLGKYVSAAIRSGLLAALTLTLLGQVGKPENLSPGPSDALFDPTRVIQIEIRLDPKDWHALRISHPILENENNISITEQGYDYFRADVVVDGQVIKSVGVRKKGAWGSVASHRPSLKIRFDEYAKEQRFGTLDMLTLNNCLHDLTKAIPFLVYNFMNKAGVPAPRSNLARLVVNGEDLGVYANVESIRKPFIKRHFTRADGDLYEPQNGADFTTNVLPRIEHKWGRDTSLAHIKELVDLLAKPGPVSLESIERLVDLDAFITFWASEVLLGLHDGYSANQNNYYLYRDAASGKFQWLPWGADTAFRDRGAYLPATVPKSVRAVGHLCLRLWELPEIRERYRREMRRLLTDVWEENAILDELNRIRRLCQNDRVPDPAQLGRPHSPRAAEESVERIRKFIAGRRQEVQAELDGPAPDWPQVRRWSGPVRADTNAPMRVEGSFSALLAQTFPPGFTNLLGQGTATLQRTMEGQTREPFHRFGAMAITKAGGRELTVIRVVATDASDSKRWNLVFQIDPYRITPETLELKKWEVEASLDHIDPILKRAQRKNPTGTLELTQVSTNLGGTISGKFKIHTTAFEEEKKP
jgi:spore coat protein CotH